MSPRARVYYSTIALLLLLDALRSIAAHSFLPEPVIEAAAATAAAPPANDLGARTYAERCAGCHGDTGKGDGPLASALTPRPRDFTRGVFKLRSTPTGQAPRREDIEASIRNGMQGTSMPAWGGLLSETEISAVTEHVRRFDPTLTWAEEAPPPPPPEIFANASAERGKQQYKSLGCPACHGKEGLGDGASVKDLRDTWNQPAQPRNLTHPWTFRGGSSAAAVCNRLAYGIGGTPMPGYLDVVSPAELANVIAYLESIAVPEPSDPAGPAELIEQSTDTLRRGAYLVAISNCGACHTPVDAAGQAVAAQYLAGGRRVDAGPHGRFFAANLTSDPDTGLGNRSEGEIAAALRSGHTRQRRLNFWAMPWMLGGVLTQEDALAIATYLKSVPAVRNAVPAPVHFGVVETVVRKLALGWPVMTPQRLDLGSGNQGRDAAAATGNWADRLGWVQVGVLILGALLAFSVRGANDFVGVTFAVAISTAVALALAAMLARYPELNVVPAEAVVQAFDSAVPNIKPAGATARQQLLWERGRYLYRTTGCVLCHAPNGSGAVKLTAPGFGTVWSANLTSASDETILRALRSGVGSRGRLMDPQATLWTAHTHLTEEDRAALLTFLTSLPEISGTIPAPEPAAGKDGADLSIWVGGNR